ncbi:5-formyltetrahydrofolate cyclo-ligase [Desulfopila inferna]|uniref:5-formyltetrahydrofolate cyclo-ligase n=1 Tax=Desulfopila inferna TaxID=468528 RepID=UPI00196245D4|nr:5-formyltetrahydrofolate cyclo-ligase [Desulfopila inferna]MBM9603937.1 5-formyltetrahydrofolate cyclo-ligase [Desulfopila inferna]
MNYAKEIRKEKLAQRDSLTIEEISEKSRIIEKKILSLDEIQSALNIFIYVSFRSEVSTLWLIEELLKNSKKISVPITHVAERRMEAIHIEDLSRDLVPGYCNIPEPNEERVRNNVTDPFNIDVVIIPGSVFDERGARFGYGGGYYDRFLEKIPFAVRIGLAFEMQMVEEAPIQPHDELLDYIVTEQRTIKAKRL